MSSFYVPKVAQKMYVKEIFKSALVAVPNRPGTPVMCCSQHALPLPSPPFQSQRTDPGSAEAKQWHFTTSGMGTPFPSWAARPA